MNSSIPGNSDVFYALAYGDNDLYFDSNDYYLTNIMHYHVEDKQDTELFGLYIIQYMIQNKVISMLKKGLCFQISYWRMK